MQRCAAHLASRTDLNESRLLGTKAVQCAVQGQTGKMATPAAPALKGPLPDSVCRRGRVSGGQPRKDSPRHWINREGNGITREMTDYLTPLMEGRGTGAVPEPLS